MYILPPPPLMDEVFSEERVKKDNEMGGNIPGGNFLGGVWWVVIFPGEIFLEPSLQILYARLNNLYQMKWGDFPLMH